MLEMSDLYLVLIVPTIWSLATKKIIKSAAEMADIKRDKFTIVPDSDAALHYCRHFLCKRKNVPQSGISHSHFTPESRYMLIDANSSIVITVYKVTVFAQENESSLTCGGAWGIQLINQAFENIMSDIFSRNVFEQFKTTEKERYQQMMQALQEKMRLATISATIRMKAPVKLIEMYNGTTGNEFSKTIDCSPYKEKIRFVKNYMKFQAEVFQGLFEESIQNTIKQIELIRGDTQIQAIIMVGLLSESSIFQNGIKSKYAGSGIDVIIPENPSTAVPQGAVMIGHSQASMEKPKLYSMK